MQTVMNRKDRLWHRKKLRNHLTPAEAILWKILKGRQIGGAKFRRQHSVGPYVLDFYCPELKLAIELDGEIHGRREAEDERRTRYLRKVKGIEVLRFENRTVFEEMERICREIEERAVAETERSI